MTLRLGLIGTGFVANPHAIGYSRVAPGVSITAACDPRAEVLAEFAARYGVPHTYPTSAQLLDSGEVDAVVLLTPPAIRDEVIFPAIERGIHLLIEKPFASTARDALRYTTAAEAGGVTLAVSQNFRWFPEYQWLADQLRRAEAGPVIYLGATAFQNRPQPKGVWRADQTRLEMAIFSVHLIDRLQWLAGLGGAVPTSVSAVTRQDEAAGLPGEQFTTLIVQFDSGAVATMTSSWLSKRLPRHECRVDTTVGSAVVDRPGPMTGDAHGAAEFGDDRADATFPDPDGLHAAESYGYSVAEFARAIAAGEEPEHSGRNNLRTMGIMDAAYLSAARGGEQVEIAEVLPGGLS